MPAHLAGAGNHDPGPDPNPNPNPNPNLTPVRLLGVRVRLGLGLGLGRGLPAPNTHHSKTPSLHYSVPLSCCAGVKQARWARRVAVVPVRAAAAASMYMTSIWYFTAS